MCKPLTVKNRITILCPSCRKVNVYRKKQIEKAQTYGYYTCKNCGTEFDENGVDIDLWDFYDDIK